MAGNKGKKAAKAQKRQSRRQGTVTRLVGNPNTGVVRTTKIKRAPAGGLVITKKSQRKR